MGVKVSWIQESSVRRLSAQTPKDFHGLIFQVSTASLQTGSMKKLWVKKGDFTKLSPKSPFISSFRLGVSKLSERTRNHSFVYYTCGFLDESWKQFL